MAAVGQLLVYSVKLMSHYGFSVVGVLIINDKMNVAYRLVNDEAEGLNRILRQSNMNKYLNYTITKWGN